MAFLKVSERIYRSAASWCYFKATLFRSLQLCQSRTCQKNHSVLQSYFTVKLNSTSVSIANLYVTVIFICRSVKHNIFVRKSLKENPKDLTANTATLTISLLATCLRLYVFGDLVSPLFR